MKYRDNARLCFEHEPDDSECGVTVYRYLISKKLILIVDNSIIYTSYYSGITFPFLNKDKEDLITKAESKPCLVKVCKKILTNHTRDITELGPKYLAGKPDYKWYTDTNQNIIFSIF